MTLDSKALEAAAKVLAARRRLTMSAPAENDARAAIEAYLCALPAALSSDAYTRGWADGREAAAKVFDELARDSHVPEWGDAYDATADMIRALSVPGGEHG